LALLHVLLTAHLGLLAGWLACRAFYGGRKEAGGGEGQGNMGATTDYSSVGLNYEEAAVGGPPPAPVPPPPPSGGEGSSGVSALQLGEGEKGGRGDSGLTQRQRRERELERDKERRAKEREEKQTWNALGSRFGIRNYYNLRSRERLDRQRLEKEQEAKSEVVTPPPPPIVEQRAP